MADKFAGFTGLQSLGKQEASLQGSGRVGELLWYWCGCEAGVQVSVWKAILSGGPQEMRLGGGNE